MARDRISSSTRQSSRSSRALTEAYDTLGGFVTAQLGRFPRQGESFEAAGARFVVETIEGKRIRRVRVTRLQPSAEPA